MDGESCVTAGGELRECGPTVGQLRTRKRSPVKKAAEVEMGAGA